MKMRSTIPAFFLLSVLLLGTPAVCPGADNAAMPPAPADQAAALPAGVDNAAVPAAPDNAAVLSAAPDNVAALPPGADNAAAGEADELREPNFGAEPSPPVRISDPIEPFNRAMFVFNDRFYYWVAKPMAKGYNHVLNQDIRVAIRNFFRNLAAPIRVANNLLQGEFRATGTEVARFAMNSTMGILGFFDVARDFGIRRTDADLGQTLGRYGLGHGFYLVLPFLGPSSLRDGVGRFGDGFLDPVDYIRPWEAAAGVSAYRSENDVSLRLGQYEELTEPALDPYIAVRDAYIQNRAKVLKRKQPAEP